MPAAMVSEKWADSKIMRKQMTWRTRIFGMDRFVGSGSGDNGLRGDSGGNCDQDEYNSIDGTIRSWTKGVVDKKWERNLNGGAIKMT
ncbi:13083_t:CDS:2 [Acaulospora colombiana]|uniref:13083_t:CDS:1 n=1 Tax=Acaulospora colombiana TaxID=27376 RepID=A0ACA9LLP9_9GLOM|nr:13083_t:CDS:2 [Acaulospora colombiana]